MDAMQFQGFVDKDTFGIVESPARLSPTSADWVSTGKTDQVGGIIWELARLMEKRFPELRVDFLETSPSPSHLSP